MSKKEISVLKGKEQKLLDKIQKAKQDLNRLKDKRKKEIGGLACKHGLNDFSNSILDKAFSKLAKELTNGNA